MNDKLINYKNQLVEYIMKTFFANEKDFFAFLEEKSFLTVLLEISSLSHRYCQSNDEKLKRLLIKQLIILLFDLEIISRYSNYLQNLGITYNDVDASQPTIYTPYTINDEEINIIDTIGKMSCNLAMGLWNNFTDKNYSITRIIQYFQQLKEEKNFGLFIIEIELYLISLVSKQDIDYINDILPNAFFIKDKHSKIKSILNNISKNKKNPVPDLQREIKNQNKITIVEQPMEYNERNIENKEHEEFNKEEFKQIQDRVKEGEEVYEIEPLDENKESDNIQEQENKEITLKESHINENGELEASKIKTTVVSTEEGK